MSNKVDLIIDQGTTYSVELDLIDDNGDVMALDGYTANSQIRRWYTSNNASATFTTTINASAGKITLSLTANQSSNLVYGRYVYDVEISNDAGTSRVVEGVITITPEVTR